jgi:hypothetical protein
VHGRAGRSPGRADPVAAETPKTCAVDIDLADLVSAERGALQSMAGALSYVAYIGGNNDPEFDAYQVEEREKKKKSKARGASLAASAAVGSMAKPRPIVRFVDFRLQVKQKAKRKS